ncbi:hypothetical protein ACFWFR_15365 [Oerskovia sp. NPDC060287]|uniref:hypothetical protein n=1 Tax=Oerskovia sp. NPDC060287 TaxID=3347095 RepID=UPI003666D919
MSIYAYLLLILTNTLPERSRPQLSALATFWADPWHVESRCRLADALSSLVRAQRLMLVARSAPAIEWESELLRMMEMFDGDASRELYPGTYSVESLQVAASDDSGASLAREFGSSTPGELVQALVTEALGDVHELDVAIERFVSSSLGSFGPDSKREAAELLAKRTQGERYTISEAMTSVMLSADMSREQALVNSGVSAAFERSMRGSELGRRKFAQCFLNGLDPLEISVEP